MLISDGFSDIKMARKRDKGTCKIVPIIAMTEF